MKLTIFHYHLLPGGVTQVITSSVISMLKFIPDITEITLVCGREDNTDNVLGKIEKETGKKVKAAVIPETGYISDYEGNIESSKLEEELKSRFGGSVWWIHNYHLGKNPVFTDTLLKIAESSSPVKMVFQIHDFPECARYEYVKALNETTKGRNLYPVSENIRYAVINSRDKGILSSSGIPEELIYTLYNPVTEALDEESPGTADKTYREMDRFFKETERSYLPGRPVFIYPVRSIRRKNVLEAGFLTRLFPEPVNLFVTLPGISDTEKRYSKQAERAFEEKLISGVFASGIKGDRGGFGFKRQIAASTAVISSSVQEGFGYLYINTVLWKKPLLARRLDIMSDIEELLPGKTTSMYERIMVPAGKSVIEEVTGAYGNKIKNLEAVLPPEAVSSLKDQLTSIVRGNLIGYSYLPVETQIEFLKKLGDTGFRSEAVSANSGILEKAEDTSFRDTAGAEVPDLERFSLKTHAAAAERILKSFGKDSNFNTKEDINRRILTTFAKIDYLRLLYDFY